MTSVGRKTGHGTTQAIANCQAYLGPDGTMRRLWAISLLPTVEWKGRTLYALQCHGTSGKGSHVVNVPLALVWALIDLGRYFCPYHTGDVWAADPASGVVAVRAKVG